MKTSQLLLALALLPPAAIAGRWLVQSGLDSVYYRGATSDHFDGERFFNPEGDRKSGKSIRNITIDRLRRALSGRPGAGWPRSLPITPDKPPEAVAGAALRVTWVGHATVLIQTQGLNILTDPVWSDRVGPYSRTGPARFHAPGVDMDNLPRIDMVLVSHNHYDHMDLDALEVLWKRDRPHIITSLGNDTILRSRGIQALACDWGAIVRITPDLSVTVERVHHWSSRWGADRRRALWSGFTITSPHGNIFFAGDTGWGDGAWVSAAKGHGPYRLALLPIGAYHPREVYGDDHLDPQQAVEVFRRLGAAHALAIHWGTFPLTDEARDDPPRELADAMDKANIDRSRFRAIVPGGTWLVSDLDGSLKAEGN